jgi:hypothetical protein
MDALSPDRFEIGVRELVICFAYLVACALHYPISNFGGGSMWYLVMLLMAKAILVVCNRAQIPCAVQVLIFVSMQWAYLISPPASFVGCPPASFHGPKTYDACGAYSALALDAAFQAVKLRSLVIYGFTFLEGPALVKRLRGLRHDLPSLRLLLCPLALVLFAASVILSSKYVESMTLYTGLTFAEMVPLILLMVAIVNLPKSLHLDIVSRNALGSYVSSCVFYDTLPWSRQTIFWVSIDRVGGPSLQLLAMTFLLLGWVYIIGPATQWLLLSPIKVGQRALMPMRESTTWSK